jgi:phosphate starvation-inducible PhoH-like protein
LSKRKYGSLRKRDREHRFNEHDQTFYTNPSKTIDFTQNQPRPKARPKTAELIPKSVNQEKYIVALQDKSVDIVVVSGPAGTGKTYLGMIAAMQALQSGKCNNIILTRPAVGVDDEKHGFLPGDLNAKMEPWTRPLLDVMKEFYSVKDIAYMLEEQTVEIAPLAFCRGRNFKNAWVILDEAQNATPSQLKMIMTRIGWGSKLIITGDIEQTDRKTPQNGLLDLTDRLGRCPVPGLTECKFTVKDVQRHRIIEHVLKLYE